MRKRYVLLFLVLSLFVLCSCAGLAKSQWIVWGYVDANGKEVAKAGADGAFSTMLIDFTDDKSGTLSINGASYPFSYKKDKNITATLQDGQTIVMSQSGNKLKLTFSGVTLVFQKK